MERQTPRTQAASRPEWSDLESWVRERIQEWLQELLEEEVTEVRGRRRSERRTRVDGRGYRNGYGKPRRLTLSSGTVMVRRPRVRDLEERFESRVLSLLARRTREVSDLLPQLYLHGLLGIFGRMPEAPPGLAHGSGVARRSVGARLATDGTELSHHE